MRICCGVLCIEVDIIYEIIAVLIGIFGILAIIGMVKNG
jgi:hypothetical protein